MNLMRLGDLVNIKTGKLDANVSVEEGKYPFFTCSVTPLKIDSYSYDTECVLVAGNGDLNVKYYKGKFDAYQRTYIIETRDSNVLNVKYLYYFLEKYVEKLRTQAIGGVIKYIKLGNLTEAIIPVVPLDMQIKIVSILEKSSLLISKRQSQIIALDELTQSLFLEMFGDPTSNSKWTIKTFGEICDSKLGKMLDQKKQQGEDLLFKRYLGNRHVQWGKFVLEDLPLMGFKEAELERYRVSKGDLLICEGGEVGRCAIWKDDDDDIYYQKALHRAKIKTDTVTPEFLQNVLFIYAQRGGFKDYTTVATIAHLTAEKLNKLPIPIPPIELQKEFTLKNNAILQQREQLIKAKSEVENLYNSILQKAFKGELFQD